MEVEVKKLPKSKREIIFHFSWEEILPCLERAAFKLSENLNIQGFRPGKVPREIVEKELGKTPVLTKGVEILIQEKYQEIISQKNLQPITPPKIEILRLESEKSFSFRIEVEVLPEVKLPDYRTIAAQIKKREIEVTDQEIEETLIWLQKSRAKFEPSQSPAQKGDFLEIEYRSPQIEKGKIFQDKFFLGQGGFVAGFEENLIGLKKGQKKEFSLTWPQNFQTKVNEVSFPRPGERVTFQVEIKNIQLVKLPEIDDQFAKDLGHFENLVQLKKSIKEGIEKEKEMFEKGQRRGKILEEITKRAKIELPQALINQEKERIIRELKEKVKENLKIPFSQYLTQIKKTEEELKNSLEGSAKKRIEIFLTLREIGQKEKIEVREEEVLALVNEFLKNFPTKEKAQKELDLNQLKEYYREVIFKEKVFQLLESLPSKIQ